MNELQIKYTHLKETLKGLKSVVVAFSSGVDSTFLLKTAYDVLGQNVIAVTATSSTYPKRELDEATSFTKEHGIKHIIFNSEELDIEGFSSNPVNRCYLCKKELFTKIKALAAENNIQNILEGSNMDDNNDYRPGHKAIEELGILSPLREAKLTKAEIRELSKELGLKTFNKQSFACLSSRFPYGESITTEKLQRIDKAEDYLLGLGFSQVRVRLHNNLARIELNESDIERFLQKEFRETVYHTLKEYGFTYISLDLKGYRTGSMNETL